jgi:hypothetical protein
MNSTPSDRPGLIGSQRPRLWSAPPAATSAGPEAVALASRAGLECLPWQSWVCDVAMRERPDGRWAAFEVLLLVSRQNGKGTCLEVMELHALFVMGVNVFHTSHLMRTSRRAGVRLWKLIKQTPTLLRHVVGGKPHDTGEEVTITLLSGAFVVFMARGARAGRGLDDCDVLVLDEALFLEAKTVEAIVPTLSTRPSGQVWITSTAGVVGSSLLRAMRRRGMDGDPAMAYMDWSIAPPDPDAAFDPLDPAVVAQSNPSLGDPPAGLITMDYVRSEFALFTSEGKVQGFLRERLGVFDEDPAEAKRVIPRAAWTRRGGLTDERPGGEVAFGVAASWPDSEWCSIVVSGRLDDLDDEDPDVPTPVSVQVIEHRRGTSWVVQRLVELDEAHENCGVVIDPGGMAGNLIVDVEAAGLVVHQPTPRDVTYGAREFRASIGAEVGDVPYLRHYDQDELTDAATSAGRRTLGDAWTWQRRDATDISPLEAASLAAWGFRVHGSVEAWASWG